MSEAAIAAFITLASSLISKAPEMVKDVKEWINAIAAKGLVDAATQKGLHDWADSAAAAAIKGDVTPAWTVEPDPA